MSFTDEEAIEMFGCTEAAIIKSVEEPIFPTAPSMLVMSIASDVQEEISMGMYETARQHLNVIKYIVARYLRETE